MRRLDGSLDAAGERELAGAVRADPALGQEIAELEGVTMLLRAQPDAPAPRSFTLPYAPRPVAASEGRGLLRWTQAATAATAVLLVAIIGADIGGVGRDAGGVPADSADSMEKVGLASGGMEVSGGMDMQSESPTSEAGPIGASDQSPESMRQESEPSAPAPDAASEAAAAPLAHEADDDSELGSDDDTSGLPALRWAQLALGLATALLALGVVALSGRASRIEL